MPGLKQLIITFYASLVSAMPFCITHTFKRKHSPNLGSVLVLHIPIISKYKTQRLDGLNTSQVSTVVVTWLDRSLLGNNLVKSSIFIVSHNYDCLLT